MASHDHDTVFLLTGVTYAPPHSSDPLVKGVLRNQHKKNSLSFQNKQQTLIHTLKHKHARTRYKTNLRNF